MRKIIKGCLLVFLLIIGTSWCARPVEVKAYTQEEIAAAKAWLSANGYSPDMAGAQQAYADYQAGLIDSSGNRVTQPDSSVEVTEPEEPADSQEGAEGQEDTGSKKKKKKKEKQEDGGNDTATPPAVGQESNPASGEETPQVTQAEEEPATEADQDKKQEEDKTTPQATPSGTKAPKEQRAVMKEADTDRSTAASTVTPSAGAEQTGNYARKDNIIKVVLAAAAIFAIAAFLFLHRKKE